MVRLLSVSAQSGWKLHLEFEDGVGGEVDLSGIIGKGVFKALRDITLFERVAVGEHGQVRWTDDLEMCADSLYLQLTGKSADQIFPNLRAPADA